VATGRWNALRVEFGGKFFSVSLNGTKLFEVKDETFTEPGGVGVWTIVGRSLERIE
jgi:hypothetical protein